MTMPGARHAALRAAGHGPTEIPRLGLDAVLISSDRYEEAIYERPRRWPRAESAFWRLYADPKSNPGC